MKILIGVDGSTQGLDATRLVAALPLAVTDEVLVASVVQPPALLGAWGYVATDLTGRLYDEAWQSARANATSAIDEAAAVLAALPCPVRTVVREGHPIAELPRLVEELGADLIALGPHGSGFIDSILLGSVSQSLLQTMPTSVLVARAPIRAPERILVAFDGSPHSLAAVRLLASLPMPPTARIHVLFSTDRRLDQDALQASERSELERLMRERATEVTRQAVELLAGAGRAAESMVRDGDPKGDILTAARELECDLIVMGARGIGGFRGLILGSVSRAVSKAAPCSVLAAAHGRGGAT